MTDDLRRPPFRERGRSALGRTTMRRALATATDHAAAATRARFAEVEHERLRSAGAAIRAAAIDDLDGQLGKLRERCTENGISVHDAADAAHACRIIRGIVADVGGRAVVKSKSMASEEIGLNAALEQDGVRVVETDLGEYIVQLDHDRPSHIIAPIIHKDRAEIAEVLSREAGRELPPDPAGLAAFARDALRRDFLAADVGITGVNFAVAETGTICIVSNEGNARLATSLPPVHIALMGIERIVPTMDDLATLLPLLSGAGTGQRITAYVSLLDGPRREDEPDGPEQMHLVLLDNGRRAIAASEYREALHCIRCGACQNVCPVYRQVGGHAYGWVYGGPIGAVLTPLMRGQAEGGELSHASTLCAACDDICPVKIPLHDLLLRLRAGRVREGEAPRRERALFALWSWVWARPRAYRLSVRVGRAATRLGARRPAGPIRRWAEGRTLPGAPPAGPKDGKP